MARSRRRNNWPMRFAAILGSVTAFVGFWQLAVRNPHPPDPNGAALLPTATPTEAFTYPSSNSTPIPLPTPPDSSTGMS